ncbi:hypothetical protein C8J56DRAFT_898923 [Mycena floridula]|nr:hypothetical protein C8J56DRAFT_898923 [Mycena floridula]
MAFQGQCMPEMTVRFTIPTVSLIDGFKIHESFIIVFNNPATDKDEPLFYLWASQVHHITRHLRVNLEVATISLPFSINFHGLASSSYVNNEISKGHPPQNPFIDYDVLHLFLHCTVGTKPQVYWSTEPTCELQISHKDIEDAFDINLVFDTKVWNYKMPPQGYHILHDVHKACGFKDRYGPEMAEHLGYPLLESMLPFHNHFSLLTNCSKCKKRSQPRVQIPQTAQVQKLDFGNEVVQGQLEGQCLRLGLKSKGFLMGDGEGSDCGSTVQ